MPYSGLPENEEESSSSSSKVHSSSLRWHARQKCKTWLWSHPWWIMALLGTVCFLGGLAARTSFAGISWQMGKPGVYQGRQYWKDGVTQAVRTLWETPFARFQIHSIQLGETLISDWLWFDECDNVNILVQSGDDEFIVMKQTKYAIPGETYAVIGGLIEAEQDANNPLVAAKRELAEELGMESDQWKKLGGFVAAANRGGGTTHIFWAQRARPIPGRTKTRDGGIADGELERQDALKVSRKELLHALTAGRFREIKWTATVALALLEMTVVHENH